MAAGRKQAWRRAGYTTGVNVRRKGEPKRHSVRTRFDHALEEYAVYCECNWSARELDSRDTAKELGRAHVEQAERLAQRKNGSSGGPPPRPALGSRSASRTVRSIGATSEPVIGRQSWDRHLAAWKALDNRPRRRAI
ncbi:MAG: hypothetical protein S0880_36835 [Actinomycetota bacterium]|nr:hypothetical protein [Actinomycetota bacterium]